MIKFNFLNKYSGDILIRIKSKKTGIFYYSKIIHNTITDNYLDELMKPLYGASQDIQIGYLAFGTGETTPSSTDEILDNETYRIADTALEKIDTGQVGSEFVLDGADYIAEEATGIIKEIGFFAGSSSLPWNGGAGKNTGLLISRVLFDKTVTTDDEIFFQRIDTIIAA